MRLAIETSGAALSVALDDGKFLLADRREDIGRGHAERLIPLIAELMAEAGIDRVDEVLACVGPGSFTGIRVGVAAARAFALAWNVPAFGFSGSALVALTAALEDDAPNRVLSVRDAFRGELFVQPFSLDRFEPLAEIEAVAPEEALERARNIGAWAGDVPESECDLWSEPCGINAAGAFLLPEPFRRLPLTPLYIRAPDAKPIA